MSSKYVTIQLDQTYLSSEIMIDTCIFGTIRSTARVVDPSHVLLYQSDPISTVFFYSHFS